MLRDHLVDHHPVLWLETAAAQGWHHLTDRYGRKARINANLTVDSAEGHAGEPDLPPYSREKFENYLVRFIIANDLVSVQLFFPV